MSPKTKLGRNPFEKSERPAAAAKTAKGAAPRTAKKSKMSANRAHKAAKKRRQEASPEYVKIWRDFTYRWIPKVKACLYLRTVRLVSRFA